jgi:hypothetical protein
VATQDDVRRIAGTLPETEVDDGPQFGVSVRAGAKSKGLAWEWMERIEPRKARVPNPDVLAVRVANADEKQILLESDPEVYFTEPHYNGFPAVLVRLATIEVDELTELLTDAWRCQAPKKLVRAYDAEHPA